MAWDAELIQITTRAKTNGYYVYTHHPRFQVRVRPSIAYSRVNPRFQVRARPFYSLYSSIAESRGADTSRGQGDADEQALVCLSNQYILDASRVRVNPTHHLRFQVRA